MYLRHGDQIRFGNRYLQARETPGHTGGCLSLVLDDESKVFTGDALMIRGCGRTDFQQGSPRQLYASIWSQIFTLPDTTLIFPGHDYRGITTSSVAEEKRHNPRLGGKISEQDFSGYMDNLNLPHPRQIDVAVAANLHCGRPEDGIAPRDDASWAPLSYTFAGVWEIGPSWLEENLDSVLVIDVREPDEFAGPLGHILGATLIPLGELGAEVESVQRDKPIVAVCRSGARSTQATILLRQAGIDKVANLSGGMLRWRAEGYTVVAGRY